MPETIAVIYCFPRSGGTLLNQCLLCGPLNIVLSEINPAGSVIPPEKQATDWFQLLSPEEATAMQSKSYLDRIGVIREKALASERAFCLRDWSGLNFLDGISPWHGRPSLRLEQGLYLKRAGYRLNEIALIRRSRAVYLSIRENVAELSGLAPANFAVAYRAYLEQIAQVEKFQLEEFVSNKGIVLGKICSALQLQYAADFESRFHTIRHVTGNNTLPRPAVSAGWTTIQQPGARETGSPQPDFPPTRIFEELDEAAGYQSPLFR